MSFAGFVETLLSYADDVIVILIGLALVYFLWGLTKYIAAGDDENKRKEGREVIIWGLIGLSVMVGVWGFVNIIANVLGDAASGGGGGYYDNSNLPSGRNNFPDNNTINGDISVPTGEFPV